MTSKLFSASKIKKVCKNIKLVITDVDGVLTDGSRYYSKDGEILKKFHVRDGMGVNLLLRNNIKTVIITKEKSSIVKYWSDEINISKLFMEIKNKETLLLKICDSFSVKPCEIAYIGDDVNDIELMKLIGLSVIPNDADFYTKKYANYICKTCSGRGAFRELVNLILMSKFPQKNNLY